MKMVRITKKGVEDVAKEEDIKGEEEEVVEEEVIEEVVEVEVIENLFNLFILIYLILLKVQMPYQVF